MGWKCLDNRFQILSNIYFETGYVTSFFIWKMWLCYLPWSSSLSGSFFKKLMQTYNYRFLLVLLLLINFVFISNTFTWDLSEFVSLNRNNILLEYTIAYQCTVILFILGRKPILLHSQKMPLEVALENTCGESSIFIKATRCKNHSKVSPHI